MQSSRSTSCNFHVTGGCLTDLASVLGDPEQV